MEWAPTALVIIGAALSGGALMFDYIRANSHFGPRVIAISAGFAGLMLVGAAWEVAAGRRAAREATRFWTIAGLAALIVAAIRFYELENSAFYQFISLLTLFGFIINHHLAAALRKPFFVALSLAAIVGIFGTVSPLAAVGLIVGGLALIGICHLPIPMLARVAILLTCAVGLAALRVGWFYQGWASAILPLLASIFMFRLSVYLYDIKNGKGPKDFWGRIGYFFMFPNMVFPFFPVIDFTAWGRGYYNEGAITIYRRGVSFMLRGLIHLLLYRAIHMYFVLADDQVHDGATFLQYIVANFGLYLRISGLFHMIVGLLLLFGFNLPETHARFYFSNSFIDFWRRINIFWKDYMQKMVFNPAYMRLKRMGVPHLPGVVLSIAIVFFATWFLHAYQWFWLTGTLLFTLPDVLFWTLLGVFLIVQTVYEAKPKKPSSYGFIGPRTFIVLRTLCTFLFICLLWSFWTSTTAEEWLAVLARSGLAPAITDPAAADALQWVQTLLAVAILILVVLIACGITFGLQKTVPASPRKLIRRGEPSASEFYYGALPTVAIIGGLFLLQSPIVGALGGPGATLIAQDMRYDRPNAADVEALDRGYYENLAGGDQFNTELQDFIANRASERELKRKDEGVRFRDDYLYREFIPGAGGAVMAGEPVTYPINKWGMADKNYSLEKPAGSYRIALIGASRALGWGVPSEQRFEWLLEDRLNAEQAGKTYNAYEVLNFAMSSYDIAQRLTTFETKALPFKPDALLYVAGPLDVDYNQQAMMLLQGVRMPFRFMDEIVNQAGIKQGMTRAEIKRRLEPFGMEIAEKGYERLARDARENGVLPVWVYLPGPTDNAAEIAGLEAAAKKAGFRTINLAPQYDARLYPRNRRDPSHPNPEGHRVIADLIYKDLLNLQRQQQIDIGVSSDLDR
jgi:D-alanyl-lipoteichoic acid acyltransferase DltB (MBOAT superfamily)